jgi:hypothetical protein
MMEDKKCKNCGVALLGKYCSACGQKVYTDKDKSVGSIVHELIHFLTHFDGKFFSTLKSVYLSPGNISVDYSNGIRQKYYKPISLYLLIVILYLLFPLVDGMNAEMNNYEQIGIFGDYISAKIDNKITKENLSAEVLSEKFGARSKNITKFSLLLLIPLSFPLLYLFYFNRKRYLFDNVILLTEINIFYLLTFFILVPLVILPFSYFLKLNLADDFYAPLTVVSFGIYSIILFHRVFSEKWIIAILKGSLFSFLFILMTVTIYRYLVFEMIFFTI